MSEPQREILHARLDGDDHVAIFWPWLRAIAVLNIVMAGISLVLNVVNLSGLWREITRGKASGRFWLTGGLLQSFAIGIALPGLHLISSLQCLKLRPLARTWLMIYCWVELGLQVIGTGQVMLYRMVWTDFRYVTSQLNELTIRSVLPLITLLLLTRPPIRALFIPDAKGFDVIR